MDTVRPLYHQPGRVGSTDIQGSGIGIADRQFGGALSATRNAGYSYPEDQEGGAAAADGATAFGGVERLADQTRHL